MMGFGFWPFGMFFMFCFWAMVIAGMYSMMRSGGGPGMMGSKNSGSSALDTLKERYAKGEIDKAEFEEKKKDLS